MKHTIVLTLLLCACAGPKGDLGATGAVGIPGPKGQDGTSITPVKFCQDDTSGFPEYGMVLGTDIYAVYWDASKGAFWAKLTPGRYMSTNGTGCTFTVNADGTVSQ